ncbi:hypothetical protein [Paraburkholderia sp. RL17-337-BIB-A]|uniref:hypothetical protein n=1 Tax=Paraburkholderia sp. RL17-337-BIB-A TaxID=3031636 RepID=UPI0038BD1D16
MKNEREQNLLKRVDLIFGDVFLYVLGNSGIFVVRARAWLATLGQLQGGGRQAACVNCGQVRM